jgi:hypothetical protein
VLAGRSVKRRRADQLVMQVGCPLHRQDAVIDPASSRQPIGTAAEVAARSTVKRSLGAFFFVMVKLDTFAF